MLFCQDQWRVKSKGTYPFSYAAQLRLLGFPVEHGNNFPPMIGGEQNNTNTMDEKQKPVTGSNEHHAVIDSRISALESQVSGLNGTIGTQNTVISSLQSSVSSLTTHVDSLKRQVDALQRVNPAG